MLTLERLHESSSFEKLSLSERFQRLLEEFCEQATKEGLGLEPYAKESPMAPFQALPAEFQALVYNNFQRYYRLYSLSSAEGIGITEDRALVWKLIRDLDLRPCSDLMERIQDGDVIEAYDQSFIQVFRNARFLQMCTYPVDHVFCCEFPQLFSRPAEITNRLVELGTALFRGQLQKTVATEIPEHHMQEIASRRRRMFLIKQGIISPLFDRERRPVLGVATLKAIVIGEDADVSAG